MGVALELCRGPLGTIIGQVEPDLNRVGESGISEVSSAQWITAGAVFLVAILAAILARRAVERVALGLFPVGISRLAGRTAAFFVLLLGLIYALSSIDVRIGPLLAGLGILGIAAAFALQEILSNFASGLLLQTRRPFKVGDQIRTNDYEGSVVDVNLRSVELKTFDGETIYLPNSMVLQNPISNWTDTPTRRSVLEIGVAYDTDLEGAKATMIQATRSVSEVEPTPEPEAYVFEFGESSINIALRFWHGAQIGEMWATRDRVARSVKSALAEAGYETPFPQRTLWFGHGQTELAVRERRPGGGPGLES